MSAKLRNVWENISISLWFVPTLLVLVATALALLLVQADRALGQSASLFGLVNVDVTPDAVRLLLSVVAGSLVTAISISFSIMIVAIQQVAVQFSPRVLRTFMADRGNQTVLGTYIATFVYCLLVLLAVRGGDSDGQVFVPTLAVVVGLGLALLCLALLVYFIHHMSHTLQVAVAIDRIHDELIEQIEELYPPLGEGAPVVPRAQAMPNGTVPLALVRSSEAGFIRNIDMEALRELPIDDATLVQIRRQVGDFIPYGGVLAAIYGERADADLANAVRDAVIIGRERSIYQDPLFGIRQLADIALKALSPAINDMTTAEYVLVHLGDALGHLARRELLLRALPHTNGRCRILLDQPDWGQYVDAAFSQIRRQAAGDVHVTDTLLRVLRDLADHEMPAERKEAIQHQVDEIRRAVAKQSFSDADRELLLAGAGRVEERLGRIDRPEADVDRIDKILQD